MASSQSPRSPFHNGYSVTSPLIQNSPRTGAPSHLRKRSITLDTSNGLASIVSPTDSVFSNTDTVVDLGEMDYEDDLEGQRFGCLSLEDDERTGLTDGGGFKNFTPERKQKIGRRCGARLCCLAIVGGIALAGYAVGRASKHVRMGATKMNGSKGSTSYYIASGDYRVETCNPYDQYGVLLVNTSVPKENRWAPIAAPESCQPVDYATLILDSSTKSAEPEIEFIRNRTIVFFGDSVDRDHNHHLCSFIGGRLEMIDDTHPLSPPYPEGRELPPEDYKNYMTGERTWPNNSQSRPFICHVDRLNLRVLNVFHYGFLDDDSWIDKHPHYYPPGRMEDRFDQIIVPLVASISDKYHTDITPDIVSVTSGFWGLLRLTVEQDAAREEAIRTGAMSPVDAWHKFDSFKNMDQEKRDWLEKRTREVLRHIAKGWSDQREEEIQTKPQILWRALHHIKEHHNIPFDRVQSLDQIGRSVVERLIAEGRAAEEGQVTWATWSRKAKQALGFKAEKVPETEFQALRGGLGDRLKTDNWGRLILGEETHFRDDVHPEPLPASFLYANMLMQNLKEANDRWERKNLNWWELDLPLAHV